MSIVDQFIDKLKTEQKRYDVGIAAFEEKLGLKKSTINSVVSGKNRRVPSIEKAERIAQALGWELYIGPPRSEQILEPSEVVPHYGEIGAGGSDMPTDGRVYHATGETTETTGAPIDIKPQHLNRWGGLVALTVRGRSMEPLFRDGDTLYIYGDDPTATDPNLLIGKDCAVVLAGDRKGETYIKRIRRADNGKPGYFNLESINPIWHTMADVQLLQANPVRYIRRAI